MPKYPLANFNFIGRMPPLYQGLSQSTQWLLSLARPCFHKLVLGKGAPQERQCGLTGNSIVLAQPVTGRSVPELPPPIDALTSNILVVFTNSTQNLSTAKWATVDREQYLECAAFRKRVCPAYSEVNILQDFDEARLPRRGVPEALTECFIEACFFFVLSK